MSAQIEIANSCLRKLGGEQVESLLDNTKEAILCRNSIDPSRKFVLRAHPWNIAMKRTTLSTKEGTPPIYGFANRFIFPAKFIRFVAIDPETDVDYRIEENYIATDAATINFKYVSDISEEAMDGMLRESIAAYMAFDIAYALVQSNSAREDMWVVYTRLVRLAKTADSQEENHHVADATDWTDARHNYQDFPLRKPA